MHNSEMHASFTYIHKFRAPLEKFCMQANFLPGQIDVEVETSYRLIPQQYHEPPEWTSLLFLGQLLLGEVMAGEEKWIRNITP